MPDDERMWLIPTVQSIQTQPNNDANCRDAEIGSLGTSYILDWIAFDCRQKILTGRPMGYYISQVRYNSSHNIQHI